MSSLCGEGFGCQCFASGCAYVGSDNTVHGCPAGCCNGMCLGQSGSGKTLSYIGSDSPWPMVLAAFLVLLVVLSTVFLA